MQVPITSKAMKSSILLSGFNNTSNTSSSTDSNTNSNSNEYQDKLLQPYLKAGGKVQWISTNKVVIVFANEHACDCAMKLNKNCYVRIELVDNLNRNENRDICNGKLKIYVFRWIYIEYICIYMN